MIFRTPGATTSVLIMVWFALGDAPCELLALGREKIVRALGLKPRAAPPSP